MEVQLSRDQQAKLVCMAEAQGRAPEALVQEAVERLLSYEDWFLGEVNKGLTAAERGDFLDHSDVRRMIEGRYPE